MSGKRCFGISWEVPGCRLGLLSPGTLEISGKGFPGCTRKSQIAAQDCDLRKGCPGKSRVVVLEYLDLGL